MTNRVAADDQRFPRRGMTYIEWVQSFIPGLTNEEANRLLWGCTPFPLATGYDDLLPYLTAIRDEMRTGTTLDEIIAENYRRMDEEMAADLLSAESQIEDPPRTVTGDWDLPEHVRSRPTVIVESDLL